MKHHAKMKSIVQECSSKTLCGWLSGYYLIFAFLCRQGLDAINSVVSR